jgi:hypothetical protein
MWEGELRQHIARLSSIPKTIDSRENSSAASDICNSGFNIIK